MNVIRIGLFDSDLVRLKFVAITISELVSIAIRIPRPGLTFVHGIDDGRSIDTSVNFNLTFEICGVSIELVSNDCTLSHLDVRS
jgi:hypothetical protein